MKIAKGKTATAIAIFLMLSIAASMMLAPLANAQHNPGWDIPTFAYITVSPNPVGVGQKVDILMWLDKYRTSATIWNEYRMHGYEFTITDSDDNVVVEETWATVVDTTSSQYYSWTPDEVGTYTLTFNFPGFYAGDYPSAASQSNDTYLASSATTTLTVQEEEIAAPITSYPLPTEYWTRPIYGENTDWWKVSSNWLGAGAPGYSGFSMGAAGMNVYPGDAIGSATSHIMWTKELQFGGVVGGDNFEVQGDTWFEGSAYNQRFTNPIIVNGRLIYMEPISYVVSFFGGPGGDTVCVDLRTGEEIWRRDDISYLSFAYTYDVQDVNQHGVYPAILATSSFGSLYDAYTGDFLVNVRNVPSGTTVIGPGGEYLKYVITNAGTPGSPDYRLMQWNSSKLWKGSGFATDVSTDLSPLWDTTTVTTTTNVTTTTYVNGSLVITETPTTTTSEYVDASATTRYDWNISIPWRNTMSSNPSIIFAAYNDILICRNGSLPSYTNQGEYTYFAINLNSSKGTVGSVLWWATYEGSPDKVTVVQGSVDWVSRTFSEAYKETTQHVGYSMEDGSRLWTTEGQTAMDYYGNPAFPYVAVQAAYGNYYSLAYGGILYCYDGATGDLLWTYGNGGVEGNDTSSGFYLAYPNYPAFIGAIGDGKIYTFTSEHTVNTPIYKGAKTRCINASNGAELWTLSNYDGSFFSISYAMADGYCTFFNGYDNRIYTVGRGPSATTVSAPDAVAAFGESVVIQGTVIDIAAGTTQDEQAARFPDGVPAVSDESMSDWMEYVYQQKPLPTDVTGVDVTLSVLDSNGNYREIGTATTDASGFFTYTWVPDIPGDFTVYATFEGTNGYWPSQAETAFTVMEPAEATPGPTEPPASMTDTYVLGTGITAIIAIIIAIVIGFALLLLKKR